MKKTIIVASAISTLFLASCGGGRNVEVIDPTDASQLETGIGASDIQLTVDKMVNSLLTSGSVVRITKDKRPVIMVSTVKNKTTQHIDPKIITDSIRTKLIRSGKFRFIDRATDEELIKEIKYQQESGLVDQSKAVQFGNQSGVEYIITGTIAEVTQEAGRVKDVYYKVTMELKNLNTGELDWADEKQIRKTGTKKWFNW